MNHESELEIIRNTLPYGDACLNCHGAAYGPDRVPCPQCHGTGADPYVSALVEGQFKYMNNQIFNLKRTIFFLLQERGRIGFVITAQDLEKIDDDFKWLQCYDDQGNIVVSISEAKSEVEQE